MSQTSTASVRVIRSRQLDFYPQTNRVYLRGAQSFRELIGTLAEAIEWCGWWDDLHREIKMINEVYVEGIMEGRP